MAKQGSFYNSLMMNITKLARKSNLCRKTVRERLREGWNSSQIKRFYERHRRIRKAEAVKTKTALLIDEIERNSGCKFCSLLARIYEKTQNLDEIAEYMGITRQQLEQCMKLKNIRIKK